MITDRGTGGDTVLRTLLPTGSGRPRAAITPTTYRTLSKGEITFVSSFPGRATIDVTRDDEVVATVEGHAVAGTNRLTLPASLPRAELRLTLTVAGGDGMAASANLAATTETRLERKRALRLLRSLASSMGDGDSEAYFGTRVGRCMRVSALRLDCRAIDVAGGPGVRKRRRCAAVLTTVLRPDGTRTFRHQGRSACRGVS